MLKEWRNDYGTGETAEKTVDVLLYDCADYPDII